MKKTVKMQDIIFPNESEPIPEEFDKLPEESNEEVIEDSFQSEEISSQPEELQPEESPAEIELEDFFSSSRPPKVKKIKRSHPLQLQTKKKIWSGVVVISLLVLAIISISALAKTKITIKARTEEASWQADLTVDKNIAFIDLEKKAIPGQFFQIEKESQKEFPTTQEKELKEKAAGTITVYNQYSSAPQALVAGTRFVAENKKVFRTTKTTIVPGAKVEGGQIIPSSIDLAVEASEVGDKYNIDPTSFTIPGFKGTAKYDGFYGQSKEAMSGGIVGRVKVVSEDDLQGAKDILMVELQKEAKTELKKKIPAGLEILDKSIVEDVVESSSDLQAGQPGDKFTVKIKVAAKVLGFNRNDVVSLINDSFDSQALEGKRLLPETIKLERSLVDLNMEKGVAQLSYNIKEHLAWNIDATKIKAELAGLDEVAVRQQIISNPGIENVKISFSPFWIKKVPTNENKVKINIE